MVKDDKRRYSITLEEDLFNELEDFRYENRFPNRNAATLELIRLGLETLKKDPDYLKKMNSEAKDNG